MPDIWSAFVALEALEASNVNIESYETKSKAASFFEEIFWHCGILMICKLFVCTKRDFNLIAFLLLFPCM